MKNAIWECGFNRYILLSGRPSFCSDNNKEIMDKVIIGKYDLETSPFDKLSRTTLDTIITSNLTNVNDKLLNNPWKGVKAYHDISISIILK